MTTTWDILAEKCEKYSQDLLHGSKEQALQGNDFAASLLHDQHKRQQIRARHARKQALTAN